MNNPIAAQMQAHLDNLTKPRGSLGRLENLVIQLAVIQERVPPKIDKKAVYVFAGDHGIVAEGVSLYPQEVTYQMLVNFLSGGAAINALASGLDGVNDDGLHSSEPSRSAWDLVAVDAGVAADTTELQKSAAELPKGRRFINAKIGPGTANFLHQPAMTEAALEEALEAGKNLAEDASRQGYDLVAIGDMGIGNTSTAAALLVASGFPLESIVDRGTGIDYKTLAHKQQVIAQAIKRHTPFSSPLDILCKVGGYDLAMMAGFILGLRQRRIGCIIDGFPVTSAAYMAYSIDKTVRDFLFAGHRSKVRGHSPVLEAMGLEPILDLGMHLGEGTGAVLAGYIIELAVKTSRTMASFTSAGVSDSTHEEEKY
ncbi:nicotinate-nucleotide--dimethylbenzimidazole phosphoribosyltransferase [Gracilinema caldarium]|uniref:Nicotinate-nucleotide--dimethylbenzimidazole phosphoribosyltransferase n=1 Tax=Gracilinema caldarium (strain ATCC 51460 / DSM 7334 / H1) TaxID=744872 RepID=F8EZB2_GRAC1|nr:nicotinate-nucleotide--dimethylbenzimidazole phosphoribosyltransferase [Gracilinema caldarium]AEJ19704.1 nicotinate-nucleotide/dimethylbenzimidazole phosphoribosyltransferase [Gracilinema caldarium DSM 7334]